MLKVEVVLRNPKMAVAILAQGESLDQHRVSKPEATISTVSQKVHARRRLSAPRVANTYIDHVDTLVAFDLQSICAVGLQEEELGE